MLPIVNISAEKLCSFRETTVFEKRKLVLDQRNTDR